MTGIWICRAVSLGLESLTAQVVYFHGSVGLSQAAAALAVLSALLGMVAVRSKRSLAIDGPSPSAARSFRVFVFASAFCLAAVGLVLLLLLHYGVL